MAADDSLPVFDRGGQAPLGSPDNEPKRVVGGSARILPTDDLPQAAAQAERSRPDTPDETIDGLDATDEEIRRQAEDLPLDTPGRQ